MRDNVTAASLYSKYLPYSQVFAVNSEIYDKWRDCFGECFGDFSVKAVIAVVKGLLSVCI